MASDIQRGTRKMDASDWIRLKRLGGSRFMYTNGIPNSEDVTNPPPVNCCVATKNNRHVYSELGISRIRRPASNYTDYIASQTADFVLETTNRLTGGKILAQQRICSCSPLINIIKGSNGICRKCGYDRIENR